MERQNYTMQEIGDLVRTGVENKYEAILLESNGEKLEWMDKYLINLVPEERRLADFFFSYDRQRLRQMGERIVDAFLHGFLSQSRDRAGRTLVRFYYQVGQEALAKETFFALQRRGLTPSVQKPGSLTPESGRQWPESEGDLLEWMAAYDAAFQTFEPELKNTCGMIGIGQFGQSAQLTQRPAQGTEEARKLAARLSNYVRNEEGRLIPPSTISFCKCAFPNLLAGERFVEMFEDVMEMNLVDSEPYERMQQHVIDALDRCVRVHILGRNGNRTDLSVQMFPVAEADRQSNFLNCGGDLNIPYGELFTTPRLQGTSGRFHIREIYLSGVPYRDLELEFWDGYLVQVASAEGVEYVRENLLYPHETMTMGEFSIGSNTHAYAIAQKYDLVSRLPILWMEKMGPHIAIGDPCFARGEDAPVYNLYDGKEMVARENERTALRAKDEIYYNKHIDITLPYGDIASLNGYTAAGEEIAVIRDGRFVLEGAEKLNQGLEGLA